MRQFVHMLLGLCVLDVFISFTVDASRWPWTTDGKRGPERRKVRDANNLRPIDCSLGNWVPWTPCDACTDITYRYRYLERPSQFGGTACRELWERRQCPAATTQCLVPDYCGESFTCKESGRCISQSLRCNGEDDCGDASDEESCNTVNQRDDKCSTLMPIPGAQRGTQGYNILTGDFMHHVLDPKYFGGQCEYVYNGEWRKFLYNAFCESLQYNDEFKNYRKPYNYHSYRFVAEATSQGSHEYYEDAASLLRARQSSSSSNGGVTVGVSYVEVGLSGSQESDFLKNLTKFNSQNLEFVRLWSKVQTANFKMRSNDLMLHEDFYVSLMELPEEYDFGKYYRFFNTYGTHYVTEGTMGGSLEYVLVLNKTAMANSTVESEEYGRCVGASLGLGSPIGLVTLFCLFCLLKKGAFADSALVEDVVTLVKGGVTYSGTALLAVKNSDTYRKWGATLKYNPALIDFELMPIHELVRLSTAATEVGARLGNLRRGLDEYLQQFHSCRCSPCRHNGIPVLTGTSCSCMCKSGYFGDACEQTLRRDTTSDGAWSCWGAWSSCTSGRKTRTRSCNNPAPDRGAPCLGSTSQRQVC
uniref:Complement C8 alpha chain n=1 Tax=Echeneis naucrates TaxID=173247 RepID=A0A665UZ97_ECHNA